MIFDGKSKEDRRRSPRFSFIKFVRCDRGGSFGTVGAQEDEIEAAVVNVGEDGLCLLLKKPLEEATVIKIALPIPAINVATPTLAEIRWVKKRHWMKSCIVGCRFLI
jgi:hypothetical protein